MADRILMTPSELRECANTMTSQKDEILALVEAINSRVNEVTSSWEGAARDAYAQMWDSMYQPALRQNFPETIETMAKMMTSAADGLESADDSIASSMQI